MIHPLILYPLWIGLCTGPARSRFVATSILLLALMMAVAMRGWWRGFGDPQVISVLFVGMSFSLLAISLRWGQRFVDWRIGNPSAVPAPRSSQAFRIQFRLRLLLTGITLAACVLALYRYYYPNGFPKELISGWCDEISRVASTMPFIVLVLLPTVFVPCMILAFRGFSQSFVVVVIGGAVCWFGLNCVLLWLGSRFRGYEPEIVWAQLGASAAGLLSALVLRCLGYRFFRIVENEGSRVEKNSRNR